MGVSPTGRSPPYRHRGGDQIVCEWDESAVAYLATCSARHTLALPVAELGPGFGAFSCRGHDPDGPICGRHIHGDLCI